jgi:hypothetical protein
MAQVRLAGINSRGAATYSFKIGNAPDFVVPVSETYGRGIDTSKYKKAKTEQWIETTGEGNDSCLRGAVRRAARRIQIGDTPSFVVPGDVGHRNRTGAVVTYESGVCVSRGFALIPTSKKLVSQPQQPQQTATGNNTYVELNSIATTTTNHTVTITVENWGTTVLTTLTIEVLDGNNNPVTVTVTGLPASLAAGASANIQIVLPAGVVQPVTISVKQGTQTLVQLTNINSSVPTPAPPSDVITVPDAAILPTTETLVVVPGAGSIYFLENGTQKTVPSGALADWIIVPTGVPIVKQATPTAQSGKVVVPNSANLQSLPAPITWTIYEIQSQGVAIADGYMGVSE